MQLTPNFARYHLVLRFRLRCAVANTVWCVAGLWLFTACGKIMSLVEAYALVALDPTAPTSTQLALLYALELIGILFNIGW